MRRFAVLVALLAVMLGVQLLRPDESSADRPIVLAAIGFVLLASFTVAEMGSVLTLPRVTGYIITGALLASFGILSGPVVLEMKMFNTLALGLIAISAGLELSVAQLRKVLKTLSGTILAKVLIVAPLVALTFYLYERHLGPLGLARDATIAVALVLGALSLGTSPSISLAIISETKSRGRLTDIVLGAAVLKDLVVVIAIALAIALARGLLASTGEAGVPLSHVFLELGYSILAGAILGVLLILYIRYIKAEMLLFVAAMILVVGEVSSLLHLELLLVFIAGGFVVRNFSHFEHELLKPVELVSLPVFVVFFTIAGASIDIAGTLKLLPLALTLGVVRAALYALCAYLGNSLGREPAAVRENAWLGYLPQAGVSLGMVGLVATQLPEISGPMMGVGMAVVTVNLLVGPVALRFALKRSGEVPSSTDAPSSSPSDASAVGDEAEDEDVVLRLPEKLRSPFRRLDKQLAQHVTSHVSHHGAQVGKELLKNFQELARTLATSEARANELWQAFRPTLAKQERTASECREMFLQGRSLIRKLPDVLDVPLEVENRRICEGDPFSVRFVKRTASVFRFVTLQRNPERRIPVRELGRLHFEPRMAELAARQMSSQMRLIAALLEDLTAPLDDDISGNTIERRLDLRITQWRRSLEAEGHAIFRRGVLAASRQAQLVDTAYLRRSQVRASLAEKHVRAALLTLEDKEGWISAFEAGFARVEAERQQSRLRLTLLTSLEREILAPSRGAAAGILTVLTSWSDAVSSLIESLSQTSPTGEERPLAELSAAFEKIDLETRTHGASALEQAMARFRAALDLRPFTHVVHSEIAGLKEDLILLRVESQASQAATSEQVTYRRFEFRKVAERLIERDALAQIEQALQAAERAPRKTSRVVIGLLESARLEVRALAEEPNHELARSRFLAALQHLKDGIDAESAEVRALGENAATVMESAIHTSLDQLERRLEREGRSLGEIVRTRSLRHLGESLRAHYLHARERGRHLVSLGMRLGERALRSDITMDVQAKYGAGDEDAETIRAFLDRHRPSPHLGEYATLFELAPLREPSNFVAHRSVLREMLDAESRWIAGGPASQLLLGEVGSGRTSLLNLFQHGSLARQVIRPNPMAWRRSVGLLQALSYELGCKPRARAIERALAGGQTLLILDDLEQWFPPGEAGIKLLDEFLELVSRTHASVYWMVSANSAWFERVSAITDVPSSFGQITRLEPVTAKELREAIERRSELSGRDLRYPTTLFGKVLAQGRPHRDRDLFFQILARASGGNLSRALSLWTHAAEFDEGGLVRPRLSRSISVGLPFVRRLSADQVAILALLMRVGPLSANEITTELCCSAPFTTRQLNFLCSSGLLLAPAEGAAHVSIPVIWAPLLEVALRDAKAL